MTRLNDGSRWNDGSVPAPGQAVMIKVRLLYIYKGDDFGNWSAWQTWTLANA